MRHSHSLSIIALLAAAVLATNAGAATVNLGGSGTSLLSIGGSGSSAATVDVNLGGGNDSNASSDIEATVNVNTGGDLLNLGGSSGTDATVTINSGGGGGTGSLLDLGGTGSETTATVDLGDTGSATVDLFGTGDDATATVDLGGASGSGVLDLFGNEGSSGTVSIGGTDLGGLDVVDTVAGVSDLVDLFGVDISGDSVGSGGSGGSGGDGDNPLIPGPGLFGPGNGTDVASVDSDFNSACFMPNDAQIAKLIARHTYTQSLMRSWAGTTKLKVVKVALCASARSSLGGLLADNANISRLQDYLARFPAIAAGLKKQGASAGDVIAVDRSGKTLVVYVI